MGQAKRRGSYEERVQQALARQPVTNEEFVECLPVPSRVAFKNLKKIIETNAPKIPLPIKLPR